MAIDWTPVAANQMAGMTGTPEYRVENDGLVRWRGLLTMTVTTGGATSYLVIPVAARPTEDVVPIYFDWNGLQASRDFNILTTTGVLIAKGQGTKLVGAVYDLAPFSYQGTVPPYVAPGQETGWIPVTTGLVGLTGTPEYKVETDGLVRWRGTVTKTVTGNSLWIVLPDAAKPIATNLPITWDWSGLEADANCSIFGAASMNVAYHNAIGKVVDLASTGVLYKGTPPALVTLPHTIANVRAGIATRLRNIVGLRVFDFPSDRIEPPAAVLSMPETPYDVTLDGRNDQWTFPLWVLVAKADDKSAYAEMTTYLEAEGTKSIRAAIEADRSLGGACDTAAVVNARPMFATIAGTEFLAVEFTLEVYT